MTHHPGALEFLSRELANVIRPVPPKPFREWLETNIVLVDGPKKGEFWSAEDAPYLPEIADCLSIEHPCNLVTVRKAQQTGVSILGLSWSLYLADEAPDNILYAVPGIDALQDMNSGKLQPLIDKWQLETGKRIIDPPTNKTGSGSTTYEKKFAGGSLFLGNTNSKMDMSGKTSRYGVKDEVSKWELLKSGEDPETLFFGRFTAFRRTKSFKIFELSTPEIDTGDELGEEPGHCRVDRSFIRSDQRFWNIRCPECSFEQAQFFENFRVDEAHPHNSAYVCEHCGHEISETERVIAVRRGRFVATKAGPDRHPGFHVDAFASLMMSYGDIADDWLKSKNLGEAGAKDFSNLILALPYAMKGNAPDYQRLMERREDYPRGVIPAEGLIVTAGADVQHNGIFLEVVAFAEDRQTWSVEAEFFPGATDDPSRGAWVLLDSFVTQPLQDALGQQRRIEALAVDSGDGGRANQVYEWCRRGPDRYAIKGLGGRGVPAIGQASKKSVTKRGKRKRFGSVMVWPVGTWSLKSELYGNMHKPGLAAGEPSDPPGYCHFGMWLGEEFFKQMTAEYFDQRLVRGRMIEEWKPLRRDNHFLDCRVYAMAMAEHLNLSRMNSQQWAALRARLIPAAAPDLFTEQAKASPDPEKTQPGTTSPKRNKARSRRRDKFKRR
ncbi:MAG: terminase gpA endonuclease subunit [Roseibium sp.]